MTKRSRMGSGSFWDSGVVKIRSRMRLRFMVFFLDVFCGQLAMKPW